MPRQFTGLGSMLLTNVIPLELAGFLLRRAKVPSGAWVLVISASDLLPGSLVTRLAVGINVVQGVVTSETTEFGKKQVMDHFGQELCQSVAQANAAAPIQWTRQLQCGVWEGFEGDGDTTHLHCRCFLGRAVACARTERTNGVKLMAGTCAPCVHACGRGGMRKGGWCQRCQRGWKGQVRWKMAVGIGI